VTVAVLLSVAPAFAQGVRERMRTAPRATAISESQANELTLTVTAVAVRPIQVWVRTAGPIDAAGKTVQATISRAEAAFVKSGQRVRAFPPEARSSMYQARVTQVALAPTGERVAVTVGLIAPARPGSSRYVLEIVTEEVERMSVPNEAIIETGGRRVVYVKDTGGYVQREIQTGLQGELFTEITGGLEANEQVVTFGSFFIDADYKLKGS
jgi:hypothetical protein